MPIGAGVSSESFPIAQLAELFEFSSGLSKPADQFGFGNPFVTFKDVYENFYLPEALSALVNTSQSEIDRCSVQRGDVFLTRTSETVDELGMSSVALKDYPRATFNGFTKRLRPKAGTEICPEYLAYVFRSPAFRQQVYALSSISTRASLNNEMLERLSIPLPPKHIQERIGAVLYALDQKIELNRQLSATLEEMARTTFKSWFINFEQVRAKAAGLPSGLQPEVDALIPNSFNDDVPTGWVHAKLTAIAELNPESWTAQTRPQSIQYVDLANTKWGKIESTAEYSAENAPSRAQRVLRPGDTIIGTVRPGNGSYALVNQEGLTASTGFAVLRPTSFSRCFVYLASSSPERIDQLAHLADGGAYPAVRPEVVAQLSITLPPEPVMRAFEDSVGAWMDRVAAAQKEASILAATRGALLPKLISGEIEAGV